jgi:phosphoglycolate phosphatase-like HAD superfamily hydrolase
MMTVYLFDIDGTLVLSGGAGKRALERVFAARYGLGEAMAGIAPNGRTDPWIVTEMFRRLGRVPEVQEIALVLADYELALAEEVARSEGYRLMPSARELLDRLRGRATLGLATGNTAQGARIKLARGGLWDYFTGKDGAPIGGFGSDSADRTDLVRRGIARASAHLGRALAPEEVLVVGDTPHDVVAAHAAGVRAAAVTTGGHSVAELAACGADQVFETLAEMMTALE